MTQMRAHNWSITSFIINEFEKHKSKMLILKTQIKLFMLFKMKNGWESPVNAWFTGVYMGQEFTD